MAKLQLRRDTAARWAQFNPVLAEGEPSYETDTLIEKIGDGVTAYNALVAKGGADAAKDSAYPYTTDFQSGTEQTRNLTSITVSSGYYFNSNLTSIYVGSNVTSIGSGAFVYCTGLTSITIGNSVTSIGVYDSASCTSLTSINIPDSVTSIGVAHSYDCTALPQSTVLLQLLPLLVVMRSLT